MRFKWHVMAAALPLGLTLALFQNCGESTRQVHLQKEVTTPNEHIALKAAEVMTYGSMKGHLDLSDTLSDGSEVSLELVNFAFNESSEVQLRNQSANLISFPFSSEGKCPLAEWFEQANSSQPPVSMGAGYVIKDLASSKFLFLLFTGILGSENTDGSFNLIQLGFKVLAPKPGLTFDMFVKDLCEEPVLNDH